VEGIPGHPFHGQANLVIENISAGTVKIVLPEGAVFTPVGQDAQALISHQNPVTPPTLPPTGGDWGGAQGLAAIGAFAAGLMLLLAGTLMRRTTH
jgi:hypothetical protein